jgi:hypothetical protein
VNMEGGWDLIRSPMECYDITEISGYATPMSVDTSTHMYFVNHDRVQLLTFWTLSIVLFLKTTFPRLDSVSVLR